MQGRERDEIVFIELVNVEDRMADLLQLKDPPCQYSVSLNQNQIEFKKTRVFSQPTLTLIVLEKLARCPQYPSRLTPFSVFLIEYAVTGG